MEAAMAATMSAEWPRGRHNARIISRSCKQEMRRVTWPSWKQVRATTGVVIAAVFAFAAYFCGRRSVLSARVIKRIFDTFFTK